MTAGWQVSTVGITESFDVVDRTACLSMPAYPFGVAEATGAFVNSRIVVCGGYLDLMSTTTDQCYSLGPNETTWKPSGNLLTPRQAAASIVMNDKLLIFGGYNTAGYLQSTEEMDETGKATLGPSMPLTIKHHCAVKINHNTAVIIGGADESSSIKLTYFYNFDSKTFESGPDLMVARERHACGMLSSNGKSFVVVTGGKNGGVILGSTEYMALDDLTTWHQGLEVLTRQP